MSWPTTRLIVIAALGAAILTQVATANDRFAQSSVVESHPVTGLRMLSQEYQTPETWLTNLAAPQDTDPDDAEKETSETDETPPANSSRRRSRSEVAASGQAGADKHEEAGGPFISTRSFLFNNDLAFIDGAAEFPVLGRMNVGEHNSPLPRNRSYAVYKHYENVLKTTVNDYTYYPLEQSDRSLDQYLVGVEKTFNNGRSSLELRLPFVDSGNSNFNAGFASDDASIGNLGIIGKRMLHRDHRKIVSVGCGVTTPTGDDTSFRVGDQTFKFRNDSVHLIPFMSMLKHSRSQRSFFISFATLDIPLGGNAIEFTDPGLGELRLGKLEDQTLLYMDFVLGHWLHRNPNRNFMTGLAVQAELHYAGSLNSADSLSGTLSGTGGNTQFDFGNSRNQFDNTIGAILIHLELWAHTDLRIAGLFPLTGEDDRFFDSETIVSLVRHY